MKKIILMTIGLIFSSNAFAAYDSTWFKADFWSGEWPHGFSVARPDVRVPARTAMNKSLQPAFACHLPYKAVFNPWNVERNKKSDVKYFTASKIVKMTAKQDFVFTDQDSSTTLPIKKGDTIEFLIYYAEGSFAVRIHGKQYVGDQDLYEKLNPVADESYRQEEWLRLRCLDGRTGWIYLADLSHTDADGNEEYIHGLWNASIGNPGVDGYGAARDLTNSEIQHGGH